MYVFLFESLMVLERVLGTLKKNFRKSKIEDNQIKTCPLGRLSNSLTISVLSSVFVINCVRGKKVSIRH